MKELVGIPCILQDNYERDKIKCMICSKTLAPFKFFIFVLVSIVSVAIILSVLLSQVKYIPTETEELRVNIAPSQIKRLLGPLDVHNIFEDEMNFIDLHRDFDMTGISPTPAPVVSSAGWVYRSGFYGSCKGAFSYTAVKLGACGLYSPNIWQQLTSTNEQTNGYLQVSVAQYSNAECSGSPLTSSYTSSLPLTCGSQRYSNESNSFSTNLQPNSGYGYQLRLYSSYSSCSADGSTDSSLPVAVKWYPINTCLSQYGYSRKYTCSGSNKVKILYYSDSQCQAYSGYGSGRPSCASYNDSIPFGTTQSYYASVACSAPPAPSPTPAPTVIDAPSGYLITKIYTGGACGQTYLAYVQPLGVCDVSISNGDDDNGYAPANGVIRFSGGRTIDGNLLVTVQIFASSGCDGDVLYTFSYNVSSICSSSTLQATTYSKSFPSWISGFNIQTYQNEAICNVGGSNPVSAIHYPVNTCLSNSSVLQDVTSSMMLTCTGTTAVTMLKYNGSTCSGAAILNETYSSTCAVEADDTPQSDGRFARTSCSAPPAHPFVLAVVQGFGGITYAQYMASQAASGLSIQQTVAQVLGHGLTPENVQITSVAELGAPIPSPSRAPATAAAAITATNAVTTATAATTTATSAAADATTVTTSTVTALHMLRHYTSVSHQQPDPTFRSSSSSSSSLSGISVSYTITAASAAALGFSSAAAAYGSLTTTLVAAVATGTFQQYLSSNANANGCTALAAATPQIPTVALVGRSTSTTSTKQTKKVVLTVGAIIGIAIGGLVFLLLLAWILYSAGFIPGSNKPFQVVRPSDSVVPTR